MPRLAQSLLESGSYDESLAEFEWLYKQYTQVKETRNDSMAKEIEKAIAYVLFQMAEQSVKAGQYEKGAEAYLALVKRYPLIDIADKAVFEAGAAYEKNQNYTKAAETFMILPKQYSKSPLTIKGIVRAGDAHKKAANAKKSDQKYFEAEYREAAQTYLFITNNFPQDSMYEIAYKRYPKDERTPGYLYSACLSYDEAKMTDEAIRCNKDLVRDYPKSSYALDAAFSIPMAYGNAKKWDLAAQEYHFFIKNYGNDDKEKLIAKTTARLSKPTTSTVCRSRTPIRVFLLKLPSTSVNTNTTRWNPMC